MTEDEEKMKRRKTCRFIEEVGRVLKVPRVTVATALVFFHRFYAKHSFQDHDRFEVAVASVLLAGKTEESPRKLLQVIEEAYKVKMRGMQAGRISAQPGASQTAGQLRMKSDGSLDLKSEEFLKLKERILLLERIILHTIGFELSIDHPYKFLVDKCKRLVHTRSIEAVESSGGASSQVMQDLLQKMVQYSMNFCNDSMQTSLCLQFSPNRIATACVYLAGQFANVRPTNKDKTWMQLLSINVNNSYEVESHVSICLQILELLADRKGGNTQAVAKTKKELQTLLAGTTETGGATPPRRPPPPPPPPSGPPAPKRPRPSD